MTLVIAYMHSKHQHRPTPWALDLRPPQISATIQSDARSAAVRIAALDESRPGLDVVHSFAWRDVAQDGMEILRLQQGQQGGDFLLHGASSKAQKRRASGASEASSRKHLPKPEPPQKGRTSEEKHRPFMGLE